MDQNHCESDMEDDDGEDVKDEAMYGGIVLYVNQPKVYKGVEFLYLQLHPPSLEVRIFILWRPSTG